MLASLNFAKNYDLQRAAYNTQCSKNNYLIILQLSLIIIIYFIINFDFVINLKNIFILHFNHFFIKLNSIISPRLLLFL